MMRVFFCLMIVVGSLEQQPQNAKKGSSRSQRPSIYGRSETGDTVNAAKGVWCAIVFCGFPILPGRNVPE